MKKCATHDIEIDNYTGEHNQATFATQLANSMQVDDKQPVH